jgi:hypothetical protein
MDLKAAKALAKERFAQVPGVQGFGIGEHEVRVYVRSQEVKDQLPERIDGVPLEAVVVGDLTAQDR